MNKERTMRARYLGLPILALAALCGGTFPGAARADTFEERIAAAKQRIEVARAQYEEAQRAQDETDKKMQTLTLRALSDIMKPNQGAWRTDEARESEETREAHRKNMERSHAAWEEWMKALQEQAELVDAMLESLGRKLRSRGAAIATPPGMVAPGPSRGARAPARSSSGTPRSID
jgi:hypothetical protein